MHESAMSTSFQHRMGLWVWLPGCSHTLRILKQTSSLQLKLGPGLAHFASFESQDRCLLVAAGHDRLSAVVFEEFSCCDTLEVLLQPETGTPCWPKLMQTITKLSTGCSPNAADSCALLSPAMQRWPCRKQDIQTEAEPQPPAGPAGEPRGYSKGPQARLQLAGPTQRDATPTPGRLSANSQVAPGISFAQQDMC